MFLELTYKAGSFLYSVGNSVYQITNVAVEAAPNPLRVVGGEVVQNLALGALSALPTPLIAAGGLYLASRDTLGKSREKKVSGEVFFQLLEECEKQLRKPFLQAQMAPCRPIEIPVDIEALRTKTDNKVKNVVRVFLAISLMQSKILGCVVSEEKLTRFLQELDEPTRNEAPLSELYFRHFGGELTKAQRVIAQVWFYAQDFMELWVQDFALNIVQEMRIKCENKDSIRELLEKVLMEVNMVSSEDFTPTDAHIRLKKASRYFVERLVEFMPQLQCFSNYYEVPIVGLFLQVMDWIMTALFKGTVTCILGGAEFIRGRVPTEGVLSLAISSLLAPENMYPKVLEQIKSLENSMKSPFLVSERSANTSLGEEELQKLVEIKAEVTLCIEKMYEWLDILKTMPVLNNDEVKEFIVTTVSLKLLHLSKKEIGQEKLENFLAHTLDAILEKEVSSACNPVIEERRPPAVRQLPHQVAYFEKKKNEKLQKNLHQEVLKIIDLFSRRILGSVTGVISAEDFGTVQEQFKVLRKEFIGCFEEFAKDVQSVEVGNIGKRALILEGSLKTLTVLLEKTQGLQRGKEGVFEEFFPICQCLREYSLFLEVGECGVDWELDILQKINNYLFESNRKGSELLVSTWDQMIFSGDIDSKARSAGIWLVNKGVGQESSKELVRKVRVIMDPHVQEAALSIALNAMVSWI